MKQFDLAEFTDLLTRCRAATGHEPKLDGDIHAALFGAMTGAEIGLSDKVADMVIYTDPDTGNGVLSPIAFTASVENAERALPDEGGYPEWQITRRYCTGYHANVGTGDDGPGHDTPALALLCAALATRLAALQSGKVQP